MLGSPAWSSRLCMGWEENVSLACVPYLTRWRRVVIVCHYGLSIPDPGKGIWKGVGLFDPRCSLWRTAVKLSCDPLRLPLSPQRAAPIVAWYDSRFKISPLRRLDKGKYSSDLRGLWILNEEESGVQICTLPLQRKYQPRGQLWCHKGQRKKCSLGPGFPGKVEMLLYALLGAATHQSLLGTCRCSH